MKTGRRVPVPPGKAIETLVSDSENNELKR
jgi:hypothetical protein